MDIEGRAERWADWRMGNVDSEVNITDTEIKALLIEAYLAGSAQTQKDYTA